MGQLGTVTLKPAATESTAYGLLKTPQVCCHPWTNWMSVQQHQFRHMTFQLCTHHSHTICFKSQITALVHNSFNRRDGTNRSDFSTLYT